jgi:hypothetical protein
MASVTQNFMKLFRGSSGGARRGKPRSRPRNSLAVRAAWANSPGSGKADTPLCVLDLGSTSPSNIRFFTERSHKIYSEDLLVASTEPIW